MAIPLDYYHGEILEQGEISFSDPETGAGSALEKSDLPEGDVNGIIVTFADL